MSAEALAVAAFLFTSIGIIFAGVWLATVFDADPSRDDSRDDSSPF